MILDECKNPILVGSSSIVLRQEAGPTIDKYSEIIRFNRAPSDGYENFVGSRTDIRVVNSHVFACIPWDRDIKRWGVEGQPADFIANLQNTSVVYIGFHKEQQFKDGMEKIDKSVMVSTIPKLPGFSVGLCTVLYLIRKGIVPTLCGYTPITDDSGNNILTHYWEERDNKSVSHNFDNENNILKKLHLEGKIKWIDSMYITK